MTPPIEVSVIIPTLRERASLANLLPRLFAVLDAAAIEAQIAARAAAKAAKNFAEADRIRGELLAQGIVLKDSAAGTTWEAAQ